MANRPVFIPTFSGYPLVQKRAITFKWHPGMSKQQKGKSIQSLHESANQEGIYPVLEISTKSLDSLGRELSAFNLRLRTRDHQLVILESLYQGSKFFERGGPYIDLYGASGREVKKDDRLKSSGKLIGFSFEGENWPLEPKTAFYDWLYISAIYDKPEIVDKLLAYEGFSDIEFNPAKSFNCQAHSAALLVSLYHRGIFKKGMPDKHVFIELLNQKSMDNDDSETKNQPFLF